MAMCHNGWYADIDRDANFINMARGIKKNGKHYRKTLTNWIKLSDIENQYKKLYFEKVEKKQGIIIPCGQCLNCKKNKRKEWVLRNNYELKKYNGQGLFITATFNDTKCPTFLRKNILQKFIKRIRYHFKNKKISYFACGEYGDKFARPHYHILIYGLTLNDFNDIKILDRKKFYNLYTSITLMNLWQNQGIISIQEITEEAIAYTSGYITKKLNHKMSKNEYELLQKYLSKHPNEKWQDNFIVCSKHLGDNLFNEIDYKKDSILFHNLKKNYYLKPPHYFDEKLKKIDFDKYAEVKRIRIKKARNEFEQFINDQRPIKDILEAKKDYDEAYEKIKKYITKY